jgi:azurin
MRVSADRCVCLSSGAQSVAVASRAFDVIMSIRHRLLLAALVCSAAVCASVSAQAPDKAPGRTIEITTGDNMKYSIDTITAKRGEQLRLRLKSVGTMPKVAMAHNIVVLKIGTDQVAFTTAAASHRATNFLPPQLKDQVIAASALAGNGETVDLGFKVPAKPGKYPFVCTFPGHFVAGMKGTLIVK